MDGIVSLVEPGIAVSERGDEYMDSGTEGACAADIYIWGRGESNKYVIYIAIMYVIPIYKLRIMSIIF